MTHIVLPPSRLEVCTVNAYVTVNVYVAVNVYVNVMIPPIPVAPCVTPGSTYGYANTKPDSSVETDNHPRRREEKEGRKSRVPPRPINHGRVIDRHIDHLWLRRLDLDAPLLHNHLLLFGVLQVTRSLRLSPQFLDCIHHFVLLIQKGIAQLLGPL
jgi:hypothetical protein